MLQDELTLSWLRLDYILSLSLSLSLSQAITIDLDSAIRSTTCTEHTRDPSNRIRDLWTLETSFTRHCGEVMGVTATNAMHFSFF